jgi:hypothetical protein
VLQLELVIELLHDERLQTLHLRTEKGQNPAVFYLNHN